MYKHMALNLATGEIICTERGCQLKRAVRMVNRVNARYGCFGKWVFAHDGDVDKLVEKTK